MVSIKNLPPLFTIRIINMAAPITASKIKPAEYLRNVYMVTPDAGTTIDEVIKPEYWVHIAKQFNPSDKIEVVPEDGAYYAELYVLSVTAGGVKVAVLSHHSFEADNLADFISTGDSGYTSLWRGPKARHCVLRKSDNYVVKEGFSSKAEADKWIADNNGLN